MDQEELQDFEDMPANNSPSVAFLDQHQELLHSNHQHLEDSRSHNTLPENSSQQGRNPQEKGNSQRVDKKGDLEQRQEREQEEGQSSMKTLLEARMDLRLR